MQSINCCDNIEGVSIIHLCEVCQRAFALTFEEECNLPKERVFTESTIAGIRHKYICNLCSIDNWKFTEHGVLINETPVTKKKKR